MSSDNLTTGYDLRGNIYFSATIDNQSGRPEIKSVTETSQIDSNLKNIVSSIADNLVMTKPITLPPNTNDPDNLVKFELEQSLLEDKSSFSFDVIESAVENRYIGLTIRNENLDYPSKVRSQALASGYMNFCKISQSELLCLADVTDQLISIVFLYQNKILDLSYIAFAETDTDFKSKLNKAAVELKTMVNFKTNEFFSLGISVPFSALYLSGDISNRLSTEIFSLYFDRKVRRPEYHRSYFSNLKPDLPLRKYLVALGLAVN